MWKYEREVWVDVREMWVGAREVETDRCGGGVDR